MENIKQLIFALLEIEQKEVAVTNRRLALYCSLCEHIQHCITETVVESCTLCVKAKERDPNIGIWFQQVKGISYDVAFECIQQLKKGRISEAEYSSILIDFLDKIDDKEDSTKTSIIVFYRTILKAWATLENVDIVDGHMRVCKMTGRDECSCEYIWDCCPINIIID